MRHRGIRIGWLLGLLVAPTLALGAGTATVQAEGQTMEVAWQDGETARIDPQGQPAYMLMQDGKLYSVSTVQGRTMVLDVSGMAAMLRQMGGRGAGGLGAVAPSAWGAARVSGVEATGRSETVAGIQGEVYEVRWRDSNGRSHTDEAVLNGDPRAVELVAVLRGVAASYSDATDKGGRTDP